MFTAGVAGAQHDAVEKPLSGCEATGHCLGTEYIPGMLSKPSGRVRPVLALNAVRIVTPSTALPAAVVPYDRDGLHSFLDRPEQDVFARRHGEGNMVVVPLAKDVALPVASTKLAPSENLGLVSALARESIFRLLVGLAPQGYRVTRRRPPTVESIKNGNLIPAELGLPEWLTRRLVLEFETRILHPTGRDSYIVATCSTRLRTGIELDCSALQAMGIPLLGAAVSSYSDSPDPRVRGRLRYAGRVVGVGNATLTLEDHGDGEETVPADGLLLEPTLANFNAVIQALTQGRAEGILKAIQSADAVWHSGARRLATVRNILTWVASQRMDLAAGVPLEFGEMLDRSGPNPSVYFPKVESIWNPRLSFDPSGSSETSGSWVQQGLDQVGPYDREAFGRKQLKIAVVCESASRSETEDAVRHFLHGLPRVKSGGARPLAPHRTGLLGRFRLEEPHVRFFEATGDNANDYIRAARSAVSEAAGNDERWDLALVQVRRTWQERGYENSPYWATKAAFLKQDVPVQALSVEMIGQTDFEYACALANMSLATYAKLGGVPWLLPLRAAGDHELVFGLGSRTVKEGRRGAGERLVGITTVFSGQGHYILDGRTAAVAFDQYPAALTATIIDAITRVRREEAWQPDDAVRLIFHAFIQVRRETADAIAAAVAELGLSRVTFAFLHVVEDHPFTTFDLAAPEGKGAFAPERGQALALGDREWLLTLTGRKQLRGDRQGLPDPVLLRLHERSTFRDMEVLARQVSDFAYHSWRTLGPTRLPITLAYSDEIARQLAGLERTPNWDADAVEGNRVMRRPWFL